MDPATYSRILQILHQEVKPALGCTEPVAVALCAARCAAEWPELQPLRVDVRVSPNILKNAMGVGIPGTGWKGLDAACALALAAGDWHCGLEVLKGTCPEALRKASEIMASGIIHIGLSDVPKLLYVETECLFPGGHKSKCILADTHDNICFVSRDGEVVLEGGCTGESEAETALDGKFLTLDLIYEFARQADLADLGLMEEEIEMNTALSEEGCRGNYGLNVGKTIASGLHRDIFGDSFATLAMAMTAAASDARMSGCPLPAMSNSGSGNQGITASMPVIAAAKSLGSSREELVRALAASNLVAIHIKSYLGRLSALCGCVVASTGSSCGIIMLKGGSVKQMGAAIKNMIGNITGMVCDGAKEGCALKVASGVSCAIQSAILALDGICIQPSDGIIDSDTEKTIRNLGLIGATGMKQTDGMILGIMTAKGNPTC